MKKIALLIGLMFVLGCAQHQEQAIANSIAWISDMSVAQELAKKENKPILIDFYTEWCSWCKRMEKDTYSNAKVQETLKQFVCVKIDAEQNRDLAKIYKINGFPSTAFLKANGELIEIIPGYLPPADFLKLLDKMLSKSK
ncbi:MAG: thioredoxin fold domain-containing protein [Candidatus Omnitrophota bacterium]